MSDLVERLHALSNNLAEMQDPIGEKFTIPNEAAAELTRLRERNAELENEREVSESAHKTKTLMIVERTARIAELEALCARLKLEAQIHSGEARAHKSTVHECYQAASGATGEKGNWNGARPVKARIASLEATVREMREALTPSAETKADYIGEFSFDVHDGYGDDGEDLYRKVAVPWTTIKEIMKAISARAALASSESVVKSETSVEFTDEARASFGKSTMDHFHK